MESSEAMARLRLAEILPTGDVGGGQQTVFDFASGLDRDVIEPEFFFLKHGTILAEKLTSLGFTCHSLGWRGNVSLQLRYDLLRALRTFEPDVIHDHFLPVLVRPWFRLFLPSASLVSSEHYPHQLWRRRHGKRLAYWISRTEYALLTRVIVHSTYVANQVAEGYGVPLRKISLIPLGIDLQKFSPVNSSLSDGSGRSDLPNNYRIGYIGRLSAEDKGVDLIPLIARAILDRGISDFHIVVVGGGPDRQSSEETCQRLGVSEKIQWLGWREDIPALLADMDLVVQPSRMETFGLSAVEALALGVRVVACDVGGVREVIGNCPDAKLVPVGDVDSLASAILEFKREHGRSRSTTSRSYVAARFDRKRFAREMQDVLTAAAQRHLVHSELSQ
jgi:L-malate glycosyltransferase